MIGLLIVLVATVIILLILLRRKQNLDRTEANALQQEINNLTLSRRHLEDTLAQRNEAIEKAEENYRRTIARYNEESAGRKEELEAAYKARIQELNEQEAARTTSLQENYDLLVAAKRELYQRDLRSIEDEIDNEFALILQNYTDKCGVIEVEEQELLEKIAARRKQYEDYIAPFQLLEKEQMEKLFWCIQIPEQDRPDIHYLLSVVSPQVRNRDVIPKVVWQEYIQKPTQDLMKRIEAEDKPGIYKITNVKTNKCYVGKSTKVRQRLIDHIKGSLGISTISDQLIHHAMLEEGLWNWTFEVVCYCDKDELGDKEKFYIENYKSREYGYNIAAGG